jgi:uncharacterized membrane protein YeiH
MERDAMSAATSPTVAATEGSRTGTVGEVVRDIFVVEMFVVRA